MADKIRMAQYGTRHGHAKGVLSVMLAHPEIEIAGVYEPDPARRERLANSGDDVWSSVRWFDDPSQFLDDPSVVAVSSEGANKESLGFTEEIIAAGKLSMTSRVVTTTRGLSGLLNWQDAVAC